MKGRERDKKTFLVGIDGSHHLRVDLSTRNGARRGDQYQRLLLLTEFLEKRRLHGFTAKGLRRTYGDLWREKVLALRRELRRDLRNLIAPPQKLTKPPPDPQYERRLSRIMR